MNVGISRSTPSIGVGQSWQNVLASRTLGTTYTNTTGKPIVVWAYVNGTSAGFVCNGSSFAMYTGTQPTQFSFIVPVGGTYSVTGSGASYWWELR